MLKRRLSFLSKWRVQFIGRLSELTKHSLELNVRKTFAAGRGFSFAKTQKSRCFAGLKVGCIFLKQ